MNRRLVIVENDPVFLNMLTDFLTARKFEVIPARTGDEGLQSIQDRHPHLVLLSRELPQTDGRVGPDGLRVLKLLKQDPALLHIPVIFMAEEVSDRDFERYRKLRFSAEDYLKKPFEDTDLLRRIENLIGFDLSESVGEIKSKIKKIINPGTNPSSVASPDLSAPDLLAAGRQEISDLMAQVDKELERQEQALEAGTPPPLPVEPEGDLAAEIERLQAELKEAQEQLLAERARAQELRGKWKKACQVLEDRWKESEEREGRMRNEMEALRLRFSDLELDHTMEFERAHQERRRLEEELLAWQDRMKLFAELPANFLEELHRASSILQSLFERTRTPKKDKS